MTLVMTGLMTALTLVATMFFKIPVGAGYIHLGDGVIILSAMMLPLGYACFAGAVGGALADIIGGFAAWAPWTFFIKLTVVLVLHAFFAIIMKRRGLQGESDAGSEGAGRRGSVSLLEIVGYASAAVITCTAYYFAEVALYGNWVVPVAGIPFNALQLGVGALIACIVYAAARRTSLRSKFFYLR